MDVKVVIIGSGPGGMQLGYFLNKLGFEYIIIEQNSFSGSFFSKFPIHKKLISINKVHTGFDDKHKNLRWDWNSLLSESLEPIFSSYDRAYFPHSDSAVKYFNDFSKINNLNIKYNTRIEKIEKNNEKFIISDQHGNLYQCDILVNATGLSNDFVPNIPGIENATNYSQLVLDYDQYINKKILIIGKGNSAYETADSLIPYAANIHLISPRDFRFAWVSHYPGDVRTVNTSFIDTFFLKQQNAILNGNIISINKKHDNNKYAVTIEYAEDEETDINEYDHIINCTGFKTNTDFFTNSCNPQLIHDDRLPQLNSEWESVNVKNLFYAGTLMQSNDYKHSSSAFIHGLRHNAKVLSEIIRQRINHDDWYYEQMDGASLIDTIFDRIQCSSSLWFLFSSLFDVFHYDDISGKYRYYRDIPDRVFIESPIFNAFTGFTFCFGYDVPNCLEERVKFSEHGFLHPILRYYQDGTLEKEQHMLEDIYGEWSDMEHFGQEFRAMIDQRLSECSTK